MLLTMLALVEMDCTRMLTFNIKKAFYLFIIFISLVLNYISNILTIELKSNHKH